MTSRFTLAGHDEILTSPVNGIDYRMVVGPSQDRGWDCTIMHFHGKWIAKSRGYASMDLAVQAGRTFVGSTSPQQFDEWEYFG